MDFLKKYKQLKTNKHSNIYNMSFNSQLSIYIPRVFPNWRNATKMTTVFENLDIGRIRRIDSSIRRQRRVSNSPRRSFISMNGLTTSILAICRSELKMLTIRQRSSMMTLGSGWSSRTQILLPRVRCDSMSASLRWRRPTLKRKPTTNTGSAPSWLRSNSRTRTSVACGTTARRKA